MIYQRELRVFHQWTLVYSLNHFKQLSVYFFKSATDTLIALLKTLVHKCAVYLMVMLMNRFLIISIAVSFALSFILSTSRESLTRDQRDQVINVIDNTFADSWCEDDYFFDFIDFSCHKTDKSCVLNFRFINTDNVIEKNQRCRLAVS